MGKLKDELKRALKKEAQSAKAPELPADDFFSMIEADVRSFDEDATRAAGADLPFYFATEKHKGTYKLIQKPDQTFEVVTISTDYHAGGQGQYMLIARRIGGDDDRRYITGPFVDEIERTVSSNDPAVTEAEALQDIRKFMLDAVGRKNARTIAKYLVPER